MLDILTSFSLEFPFCRSPEYKIQFQKSNFPVIGRIGTWHTRIFQEKGEDEMMKWWNIAALLFDRCSIITAVAAFFKFWCTVAATLKRQLPFMYINVHNYALYNATMEQILLFSALRPCKFLNFLLYGNWNDRPYKLKNV